MKKTKTFITAIALGLLASPELPASEKPNVILIMADDLGYHDLGCYGHPTIKTPVLDKLAKEGMKLTSFYSGATVCTPSRMALLTGAYPTRLGWTQGVIGFKMGRDDGMNSEALTMAEVFKSEGYATGISGKWHLGNQPDTLPTGQGFDDCYFISMSNNQTKKIWRNNKVIIERFENRLLTEQFTDEGIRFIKGNKDRPFFLYLPYSAPHFPVESHPGWKGKSEFGVYGDVVEELDARIGEILQTLEGLGLSKRTLVIFCSDNGPNPREKANTLPYRGEKWSALEGGTRVPCILNWPGNIAAGQESDALVGAIDLLPTISAACGIDLSSKTTDKPTIDGVNFWPTVLGKFKEHPRNELLYWHGMHASPQAIRIGDWKLFFDRAQALEGMGTARATKEQAEAIKPYREGLKKETSNPPMLFNLKDDPGELVDLSESYPEKVKQMKQRADALFEEIRGGKILPVSKPEKKR